MTAPDGWTLTTQSARTWTLTRGNTIITLERRSDGTLAVYAYRHAIARHTLIGAFRDVASAVAACEKGRLP